MPSLVNINSISPQLRDILLGLNLKPSPTITSNNYVQYLNGVGLPFTVSYGTGVLAPILSLQELGAIWRDATYSYNEYQAEPNEYTDSGEVIGEAVKGSISVKPSYLDANGKLNIGGPSTEAYNTISSLLKGGVGFNKNGGGGLSVVNNNDIRNTIVGRALSAGGLISDTDLGIIGAQRLAISLANNAAFKLQKETIGRVNLDIFSWIDGKKDDFIVPNYEITVPAGLFGKAVDFLGDLAGFTRPKSQMKTEFFSFDERFVPTGIGNIARANGMLETTGKGQVIALFRNMQANLLNSNFTKQGYAPGIANKRIDGDDEIRHNVYAYGDNDGEILENTTYDSPNGVGNGNARWTDVDGTGFDGDYFRYTTDGNAGNTGNGSSPTESGFIWADKTINIDKNGSETLIDDADTIFGPSPSEGETNSLYQVNRKSILYKTKELFKNGNIPTLVNGHLTISDISQIQSSVLSNGMMSKGNAALTSAAMSGNFDDRTNVYCRTWTPMDKYDQILDLVRHRTLDKDGGDYKRNSYLSEFSVLENTGFVKIARYLSDTGSIRRHMFSLENLAWSDFAWGEADKDMPGCEKGPYGGRIMWFPPYDIKFSESTSVNWDKHSFIGRGEPMYTYNNTERTGQLSFKVIIDHPNQLNKKEDNKIFDKTVFADEDAHYASYFAGCNLNDILTKAEKDKIKPVVEKPKEEVAKDSPKPPAFNIFFPNDNHTYPYNYPEYESGVATSAGINNIRVIKKDGTKTPNIGKYIGDPDPNNGNQKINYNELMGNPDPSGNKTLGPENPIPMTAADFTLYKIDYSQNQNGAYLGLGLINIVNSRIVGCATEYYIDRYNYGLNANRHDADTYNLTIPGNEKYVGCRWGGWLAANDMDDKCKVSYIAALKDHMKGPCLDCVIKIAGYASKQCACTTNAKLPKKNCKQRNQILSDKRAENIAKYFKENLLEKDDLNADKRIVAVVGEGQTAYFNDYVDADDKCAALSPTDIVGCKMNRRVKVTFEHDPTLNAPPPAEGATTTVTAPPVVTQEVVAAKAKIRGYYAECDYFAKLSEKDPFTFKKINDKIKFFSPAFHSTTPEGFNSRLTFLQQCTRQGPSVYTIETKPDNLVFGRPPVCILRIGDFYYTKIIIESLSIDYEPLVWDLNPEGVGVQPMIANVSMNFAFIGGSSLDGPISKLQNALSFNYYANTGIYAGNMAETHEGEVTADKTTDTGNPNEVFENNVQETTIPLSSSAETAQDLDREILEAGVLSLKYDDSGIFQGKVKGKFTIASKLSKAYTIKLRTKLCEACGKEDSFKKITLPKNNVASNKVEKGNLITFEDVKVTRLADEPIDIQNIKLNELKVEFESKTKTTNSLQKWDYYFTDTNFTGDYYLLAKNSLDAYVSNNTINKNDMEGDEAKGWDYIPIGSDYNYDFVLEVEELKFKKEYRARWVPKFKVDRKGTITGTKTVDTIDGPVQEDTWGYSFKSYLSGGKLDIINDKNQSSKQVSDDIAAEAEKNKEEAKNQAKAKKERDKLDKENKKNKNDDQKAKVALGGGSLL